MINFIPNKVSAIFIAYNANESFLLKQITNILDEVDDIFILDNSDFLSTAFTSYSNANCKVNYIPLMHNVGIAQAQNLGAIWARNRLSEFIVFFDQDSQIKKDTISKLKDSYLHLDKLGFNPGIVAPISVSKDEKFNYAFNFDILNKFAKVSHYQSSGSLIRVDLFFDIGMLTSSLFIDLVDNDLCWRLSKISKFTYVARDISLVHSSGDGKFESPIFSFKIPSDFRWYYLFRNTLFLLFSLGSKKSWLISHFLTMVVKVLIVSVYKRNFKFSFKPLGYSLLGFLDGLLSILIRRPISFSIKLVHLKWIN